MIQKPTKVAFNQQLAATCTSYALFNPEGIAPQDSLLPLLLPLVLPCLLNWHLLKPASQRPKLLGYKDGNGHSVADLGLGQATADGEGMGKELGIAAVAVSYSTVTAGWFSYSYFTLTAGRTAIAVEQSMPYGGATQQKPSRRGTQKTTTHVTSQQLAAKRTSSHPFNPGGLSSIRSWLNDLFYASSSLIRPRLPTGKGISIGIRLKDHGGARVWAEAMALRLATVTKARAGTMAIEL
ncbi:MAG: hypothetical protein M1836_007084 [Candelina mexicana]|nr:MAG: hypothetical protein M1836_007084 [Candelina mexicana]